VKLQENENNLGSNNTMFAYYFVSLVNSNYINLLLIREIYG